MFCVIDVILMFLLLTLNIVHTLFHIISIGDFEQVNASWDSSGYSQQIFIKYYFNSFKLEAFSTSKITPPTPKTFFLFIRLNLFQQIKPMAILQ